MASKITVFDHYAHYLTELNNTPTTPRSWVLNGYGRAEFSMSTSDPKMTLANIQHGNLIHIEHIPAQDENGDTKGKLPDWIGIILPPRAWNEGSVNITVYSGEAILDYRPMPLVSIQGTPRSMFVKILEFANQNGSYPIQAGHLDDLPVTLSDDLRLSAYEHIQLLVSKAGMYWDVTPDIDLNGNLILYANLYARKGVDTGFVLDNTNSELQNPTLTEQGAPASVVIGYSQSSTPQQRFKGTGVNQAALNDFGYLGRNVVFTGLHDSTSVRAASQVEADTRGKPVKIIKRNALDKADTFSYIETGNTVSIKIIDAGFREDGSLGTDESVRILSVDYNDLSDKAPLNVEVV